MWNAWFNLSLQGARLAWDAQTVIALRFISLGMGGVKAQSEAQRMVSEKVATLIEAQGAAAAAAIMGSSSRRTAKKVLSIYGKRVRGNKRRLAR
jgi:hypothetical protein